MPAAVADDIPDLEEEPAAPALVSPSHFKELTALGRFQRRTANTVAVDRAYAAYVKEGAAHRENLDAPAMREVSLVFLEALRTMRVAKGGSWTLVERDKTGVLSNWERFLDFTWGDFSAQEARDALAKRQGLSWEVKRARFGVLYLLGNVNLRTDWAVGFEAAGAIGGAAAMGSAVGALRDATAATREFLGYKIGTEIALGAGAWGGAKRMAAKPAEDRDFSASALRGGPRLLRETENDKLVGELFPGFEATMSVWDAAKEGYDGPADIPGLVVGGAIGGSVGLAIDLLRNTFSLIGRGIYEAVIRFANWWRKKCFGDDAFAARTVGGVVRTAVKVIISQACKAAAPFIGGALNVAQGVAQTLQATSDAFATWYDRRRITVTAGHFALISSSIEDQVSKGLLQGLWTSLKGAGDLAMTTLLPGAGSLVSVLMTGLEWVAKLIYRVVECRRIEAFLGKATALWEREKSNVASLQEQRADAGDDAQEWKGTRAPPQFNPSKKTSQGSIIHDARRFSDFFKEGCEASVLIPMVTLNSGICGSIFEQIQMLDAQDRLVSQATFDAGVRYFSTLRRISARYLGSSGYELSGKSPSAQAFVRHAVRDQSTATTGDKVRAFLGGA